MSMMTKRVLSLLLCFVLAVGFVPATTLCASAEGTEPTTVAETTAPTTEPEETTTPVTDPEETTVPTDPEETTVPTDPEETTVPTVPEETTVPTVPEETTVPTEPEETTVPTEPEETTVPTTELEKTQVVIRSRAVASASNDVQVSADDFPEYPNQGAIRIDKTASAEGAFSKTGIAQIELSMTGVPYSTGSEIDVVLVLDASDSMRDEGKGKRIEAARAAAYDLIQQICVNKDGSFNNNRVAIVYFGSSDNAAYPVSGLTTDLKQYKYSTDYGFALSSLTSLDGVYDALYGNDGDNYPRLGTTNYSNGLAIADAILSDARKASGYDRQQICVFMSDGKPTGVRQVKKFDADGKPASWTGGDYSLSTSSGLLYEYFSSMMKYEGVKMYCVGTAMAQDADQNVYTLMQNMASSADDLYYVSQEEVESGKLQDVFGDIAMKIQQAATNVIVEDQIDEKYTMIFDVPTGPKPITGASEDLCIEFVKYNLDADNERAGDPTVITKLELSQSGGRYSAVGAAPSFEAKTLGDKGTKYYWTQDASKSTDDIAVNGYYFTKNGDGTHNMTSGAYADGSVVNNMSNDLVLATPYFVYNASTRMLYWTVDKLDTTEYALRYFVYLNNSATHIGENGVQPAGTYPTNDHAKISYTNHLQHNVSKDFPVPKMTWNGAQVSYVFYLVNDDGQPINSAGQVIDFANAVFVTDIFTKQVVWNDSDTPKKDGVAYLDADYEAGNLLPEGYTPYDAGAKYKLDVYEDVQGSNLGSQFTIGGTDGKAGTTKVYNTKAGTKYSAYGTYTKDNVADDFDFANTTVAFAVVWSAKLVEDVVVVDFGLDTLIDVTRNDLVTSSISGIGTSNTGYAEPMNTGLQTASKLGTADLIIDGNTISIEDKNTVRFHQDDMQFNNPVKFFYESPVTYYGENNAKLTGYMYSSVTVVPATTIYYEDDFVELKTHETDGNGTITETTDGWPTDSVEPSATQAQDRPGASKISAALDADNKYGYDAAYAEMATHSLNNAAMIHVDANTYGSAKFTFYGTGFDVISMTSNTTGTLLVNITNADTGEVKNLFVDTYYGYTRNESGEWILTNSTDNALYQVPVIKATGLDYGRYNVEIRASYNSFFDHTGPDGYDLYLDAIRIYDPTGNNNTIANNAYKADGEAWPTYQELRNNIISKSDFDAATEGNQTSGAIFIDQQSGTYTIADYTSYGPNNELYLAENQAIAFKVTDADIADIQLGIKSANGDSVTYEINGDPYTVNTTTDMYYSILKYAKDSAVVTIENVDGGILSLTNIKVTHTTAPAAASEVSLLSMDAESAGVALMMLRKAPAVEEEVPETTVPEETEPETTVPEETEPETTVPEETEPETTVPEETEPETTEPETTVPEETEPENNKPQITPEKVASAVKEVVVKVINTLSKLFGRWFR